jgi:Terpene synthase family 2, C-terminal metal binding
MAEGMTRDWVERAAHVWVDYLEGYYTETAERLYPGRIDSRTHHRVRRKTIGVQTSLVLGELSPAMVMGPP